MRTKFIRLAAIALALVMIIMTVGCTRGAKKGVVAAVPTDDFKPVIDTGKDSDLYDRYEEYKENATLAFKDFSKAEASDFEYEIKDSGIVIEKYVGSDTIVVVPESIDGLPVTEIGECAFSGSGLKAVSIPDTVVAIAYRAFSECDSITTLRVPFIGNGSDKGFLGYIFGADSHDKNAVAVPPSLDMLIVGNKATAVEENALRGCKTLSAVILPDSVTEIGRLAFFECTDLVYVDLGNSVSKIGEYSFAYCYALYYIDCSTANEIETGAFFLCTAMNGIKLKMGENDYLGRIFGATDPEYNTDFVPQSLRNVEIAEGTVKVGHMAFYSCKYLTSVTLPNTLESIGVRSFYACRSLSSIVLTDGIKTIDDDAFFGCDALVAVTFGKSLESLGMQAFMGCEMLKKVNLPSSLKEIKSGTFYDCVALTDVSLGGVKKIGKNAFANCKALNPVSTSGITVEEGNEALSGS